MRKFLLIVAVASSTLYLAAGKASAQVTDTTKRTTPKTDTAKAFVPNQDVAAVLAGQTDYSTAALAFKAAGLDSTLKTGGPYTIFAPNNAAFVKLPTGKLDSLMKDKVKLTAFLKGHVVTGKYAKADIIKALTQGKGKATLTTVDGQSLALSVSPNKTLQLTNAAGSTAEVSLYDLLGTNGVVNGINAVLLPK